MTWLERLLMPLSGNVHEKRPRRPLTADEIVLTQDYSVTAMRRNEARRLDHEIRSSWLISTSLFTLIVLGRNLVAVRANSLRTVNP
jgi:hypothetical protein